VSPKGEVSPYRQPQLALALARVPAREPGKPLLALFGGYPTQSQVFLLESIGVKWFVDLTLGNEKKTTPYVVAKSNEYISYPIADQSVPTDIVGYVMFINRLISIISGLAGNEKLYIHCKGGHGRSGLVAATILCAMDELSPEKSIREITFSHNQRHMMKKKWKKIGSPQTRTQCNFLHSLFQSQNIDENFNLSISSPHNVVLTVNDKSSFMVCTNLYPHKPTTAVFETALDAILYLSKLHPDYKECVELVLDSKFTQHPECKQTLLETGYRQLLCSYDYFGQRCIGTICTKLRNKYLTQ
jgi:hypothetical protein